ncbi:hypothetical protein [Brevibacterium marinum]|uniref:Uncharacterized protein n=1 Tax=Brevibacterium marinum TaxID=418643 RepID=A0A846RRN0_9MICO|nr:hypothetical protein [Brevibacterium marinum]NJC56684.1 hypothetical protein [Brevibacterium marinum]
MPDFVEAHVHCYSEEGERHETMPGLTLCGDVSAVVIDPPELPAVDKELVLDQSALPLGSQGGLVELEFAEAGHHPFGSHRMVDAQRCAHRTIVIGRRDPLTEAVRIDVPPRR